MPWYGPRQSAGPGSGEGNERGSAEDDHLAESQIFISDKDYETFGSIRETCACRPCGCDCEGCRCPLHESLSRDSINSRGQGLNAPDNTLQTQARSYSSNNSVPINEHFDEQAAPQRPALTSEERFQALLRARAPRDLARAQELATRRFADNQYEHAFERADYTRPRSLADSWTDNSEMMFHMQDLGSSRHASPAQTDADNSRLGSFVSGFDRRSLPASEAIYGTGGDVFEGHGRLRPPTNFLVLSPNWGHRLYRRS